MFSYSNCFLGIDFGTSGVRCCVIDRQHNIVAESRINRRDNGASPSTEQDPLDWWADMLTALRGIPQSVLEVVINIAIDGTSSTILLCDSVGYPLTPALMYNDSRATDEAESIRQVAPSESGAHGASSSLAKLMWLQKHFPQATDGYALHQADWVSNRLCGQWGHSDYNNTLKLGFDPVTMRWPKWIGKTGIDEQWLPRVHAPGIEIGRITSEVSDATGLSMHCKVSAGTTDSIAAFIATGANSVATAVTSLGSTLVLKVISSKPVFAPEFGVYSHKLGDLWLAGGASNTGGAALREHFTDTEIRQLSSQLNPALDTGLDYYPLHGQGERFPVNDPKMTARMTPLPKNNPAKILQGLLEGIASVEQQGYTVLHQLGAPYPEQVITAGGGAINNAWTDIRHRKLGCNVLTAKQTEAAYGAALLAAQSI